MRRLWLAVPDLSSRSTTEPRTFTGPHLLIGHAGLAALLLRLQPLQREGGGGD